MRSGQDQRLARHRGPARHGTAACSQRATGAGTRYEGRCVHIQAAPAADSKTLVYSIESAALDARSYRGLLLPNGMRVLLASDPEQVKAAAARESLKPRTKPRSA